MDSNENKDKKEDSYYSYSYVRDGGNENTTWRADDYTNYSYNQAGGSQNRYETPKEKRKWFRKRQKKTERNNGFGMKLAKCAALAAVFGLVAGGVFVGTGYLGMTKLGVTKSGSDSKSVTVESTKIAGTTTSTESTEVGAIDVSGIVDEVMPSIVAITNMTEAQYRNFFGQVQNYESESAGSGIIIGQDNDYLYIVTNNHVVAGATSLTVCFVDDQTVTAEVKGTDSNSDLAVVAVKISDISGDTMKNIKVATMGDSDSVKVGESAIAIGNALGYGQSVTTGVISALDREVTLQDESTGSTTNALIQTDAAINPGNSGGALLNLQGEVIGINSAKYSDTAVEGMGYAIPIATAKPIIDDLIQRETVDEAESAYLGIAGADITEDVSKTYNMPRGIYVTKVVENSAADEAGIQKGDILTAFDGKKVSSMEGMQEMLRYYKAGEKIKVTVQQANNGQYEEKELEVTLGKKVE
ncbi:MAG: trypsin-like peptidase domain-containing protein [Lachnospiraceae bacterium]|nr:trypsin-like peptidase domain-containing protein [Lachnospiraceae bacterium]